jgi:uncharacterized membrane protein
VKLLAKSAIFLSLIAILISFVKFDHCRNFGWGAPQDYVHACYSDLPALFSDRGLTTHTWPYSSATNAVEYPPVTGLVMWVTSFAVKHDFNQYRSYFDINAILIAFLFIATVILLKRMKPDLWYLYPVAPAVIASLFINWDLWAVISALAAIYLFDKEKYIYSALLLGLSIATKFFPIVLLLPAAIILWRKEKKKELFKYGAISAAAWLAINLPFIITTPTGWFRFFKLNSTRGADWGSIWHALTEFGINIGHLNSYSTALFLVGAIAFAIFAYGIREIPTLAQSAFFIVAIFVTASKVYSPQYILWLTPLAVIAMREKRDRIAFWIWQFAELIYHFAIWQYLASYSGAHFGIPAKAYATAVLIRIIALAYFTLVLMRRSTPEFDPQNREFLLSATEGYA